MEIIKMVRQRLEGIEGRKYTEGREVHRGSIWREGK
jgi:hypothetical protein